MFNTPLVRSDYFYETRRVLLLPDRVVASRLTSGTLDYDRHLDGFKPYVYKGNGYDILTEDLELDEHGAVIPPKPPKPTKQMIARQHKARANKWLRVVRDEVERQYRAASREASRQRRLANAAKSDAKWLAEREAKRLARKRTPKTYTGPRTIRSHPDWKPMTGSDIDDLMAELEL